MSTLTSADALQPARERLRTLPALAWLLRLLAPHRPPPRAAIDRLLGERVYLGPF